MSPFEKLALTMPSLSTVTPCDLADRLAVLRARRDVNGCASCVVAAPRSKRRDCARGAPAGVNGSNVVGVVGAVSAPVESKVSVDRVAAARGQRMSPT